MPAIENMTRAQIRVLGGFDASAEERLVIVLGATYDARPGKPATFAEEQLSIEFIDRHRGDPISSSVTYPGQSAFSKPATDIVVTGHAYAPNDQPVERMRVGIRVADVQKLLVVSGDRFWRPGAAGRNPSSPRPFRRMPIIFERAFGGGARTVPGGVADYDQSNPIGIGLPGCVPSDPTVNTEVPNIEYPDEEIATGTNRPRVACFGAIGPAWQPRVRFAGTYDAEWLRIQAPLLPHDFDPRFNQVVPLDQQTSHAIGGQQVAVIGMTPEGQWTFAVPHLDTRVCLLYADRMERGQATVDTLHLEPDLYRVHLTARLSVPVIRNKAPLAEVVVGDVSHARLRSLYSRKFYYEHIGRLE